MPKDIRAELLEFESARRGYVITGDERFLESIAGLRTRWPRARNCFERLPSTIPRQQSRIDALDPLIDRRLAIDAISICAKRKALRRPLAGQQSQPANEVAQLRS
jgi:CHASE3 domain sensor protein